MKRLTAYPPAFWLILSLESFAKMLRFVWRALSRRFMF